MNNPLKYTDKSGEIFGIDDILIGAAIGAIISATTYSISTAVSGQRWSMSGFLSSVGMGAVGGALGAVSGAIGGALGSSIGNSLGYNILSQTANTVITNTLFGNKMELNDIFGIVAGAAAGTALPKYKAIKAKPFVNTLAETGFNTVRGAATGAIKGSVDAIIKNDFRYLYMDIAGGALSGFSRTIANNIVFGAPYKTVDINGTEVIYRSGGISSFLDKGFGLTLGRNIWVNNGNNDIGTMNHEGVHVLQQDHRGWADFYLSIAIEYYNDGTTDGYLEQEAYKFEASHGTKFAW